MQGGARRKGEVDTPEGNGTGFVWDNEGHVVTNFHVLASALRQLRPSQLQGEGSPKVAKLTLFSTSCYAHAILLHTQYLMRCDIACAILGHMQCWQLCLESLPCAYSVLCIATQGNGILSACFTIAASCCHDLCLVYSVVYNSEPCLHALAQQNDLVHCMSLKLCSVGQSANNHACSSDKQGYQQSYDAALVGADRSKDIVVLRLLNLQV